jgi:hypothetical protein
MQFSNCRTTVSRVSPAVSCTQAEKDRTLPGTSFQACYCPRTEHWLHLGPHGPTWVCNSVGADAHTSSLNLRRGLLNSCLNRGRFSMWAPLYRKQDEMVFCQNWWGLDPLSYLAAFALLAHSFHLTKQTSAAWDYSHCHICDEWHC